MDPKEVGRQIRALLLALKSDEDRAEGDHGGYDTDDMRALALDYAGICWLAPGEMAPWCACDWSEENPSVSRTQREQDGVMYRAALEVTLAVVERADIQRDFDRAVCHPGGIGAPTSESFAGKLERNAERQKKALDDWQSTLAQRRTGS